VTSSEDESDNQNTNKNENEQSLQEAEEEQPPEIEETPEEMQELPDEPLLPTPEPEETIETQKPEPESTETEGEFVPTEEVYRETFQDVEDYISELNNIIRNQDYEQWVGFLTPLYKESLADPEFLLSISERPVIKNRNLSVESLRDYFEYVVVPSRANIRLDDLVFLSDKEVEAIMQIGDTKITVYRLVRTDEGWKIGAF
jgi:vacuolar-type H+-ATPase subunit H